MARRGKVEYIQQDVPNFIQQMKEKAGLVNINVDHKRIQQDVDNGDDLHDRLDEQPQIVLELSNVGKEEAERFLEQNLAPKSTAGDQIKDDPTELEVPSRIMFRTSEQRNKKNGKSVTTKENRTAEHVSRDRSPLQLKSEKKLLSFNFDDDDDE